MTNHTCDYCGSQANFYSKQNKKWRCAFRVQNCPAVKAKMAERLQISQKKLKPKAEPYDGPEECSYGCGEVATWTLLGTNQGERLCCSEKYQKCPGAKSRRSKQMTEKYQDPEAKEQFLTRLQETNLKNSGVAWPGQRSDWHEKYKATVQERYGVDHVNLRPDYREENERQLIAANSYSRHSYNLPSGRVLQVQGREGEAIDHLLKNYQEEHLRFGKDVPRFQYLFNGKQCSYYPDIYIPCDNLIIEVKGLYWYRHDWNKIQTKASAVKEQGFDFKFLVYDKVRLISEEELGLEDKKQGSINKWTPAPPLGYGSLNH